MHLTKFGSLNLIDKNAEDDLAVSWRDSSVDLTNGAYDPEGDMLSLNSRRISRRVWITSKDGIETHLNTLLQVLGEGPKPLFAEDRDGVEYVTVAKVIDLGRVASVDMYDCRQPIVLSWRMAYPYWWRSSDIVLADVGNSGSVTSPLTHAEVVTSVPHTFTFDNTGQQPFSFGWLYFIPRAGATFGNIEIMNRTTSRRLRWRGNVVAEKQLVFEWHTPTVRNDGADAYSDIEVPDPNQISWMKFAIGDNEFELDAVDFAGTVDLTIEWARHYL